jgi:hypothetical protein
MNVVANLWMPAFAGMTVEKICRDRAARESLLRYRCAGKNRDQRS